MLRYDELKVTFNGFFYLRDHFGNFVEPGTTASVELPPQMSQDSGKLLLEVSWLIAKVMIVLGAGNAILCQWMKYDFNHILLAIVQLQIMFY